MVFQYNPLIHWLEVNDEHEIVATISRLDVLTPRGPVQRPRRGRGHGLRARRAVLAEFGYDIDRLNELEEVAGPRGPLPWSTPIPLPFLWIHGRSDATISVMGANIYPEDIETIIYRRSAARAASELVPVVAANRRGRHAAARRSRSSSSRASGVDDAWIDGAGQAFPGRPARH